MSKHHFEIKEKCSNFAGNKHTTHNYMACKGLWQIDVNVNNQISVSFTAEKVEYNVGIGFIEKNPEKNIVDLACIALYPKEKSIVFRSGVIICKCDVKSGNLTDFEGSYDISFFDKNGNVSIEEVEK